MNSILIKSQFISCDLYSFGFATLSINRFLINKSYIFND